KATGASIGTDTLIDIESATGSPKDDTLRGDDGPNTLQGLGGDDTLIPNQGNDTVNGGPGEDTVSYFSATSAINADLGSKITGDWSDTDTVVSIEDLIGTPYDDEIIETSVANKLDGEGGEDRVNYVNAASGVVVNLSTGKASGDGADTLS